MWERNKKPPGRGIEEKGRKTRAVKWMCDSGVVMAYFFIAVAMQFGNLISGNATATMKTVHVLAV